jgi:hypothetical protein
VRSAISAVAAISGLLLLGLAFYGQPALYLHQAQEEWDALIGSPAADHPADPDRDAAVDGPTDPDRHAAADRMAQLQQQVTQLENELAAKQAQAPQPAVPQPVAPAPVQAAAPPPEPVRTEASRPETPNPEAPRAEPHDSGVTMQAAKPEPSAVTIIERHETPGSEPLPLKPEPPRPEQPNLAFAKSDLAKPDMPKPDMPKADMPKPDMPKADMTKVDMPKLGPPNPDATRADASKSEPPRSVASKPDAPRPAPQKLASVSQVPAPPPLPQSAPARQDTAAVQSVLTRLRQLGPGAAPARQADAPPPVEPRSRPVQSPSLPGLSSARVALANGQIEEARRLLQQAQLQLVFRPVNAAGEDSPLARKGAADVARALDALSANDAPLGRRYIDTAVADLSGNGTNPPVQESEMRTTGYAPAYPSR